MPLIESGIMGEFPYAIWYNEQVGHNCGYLGVPRSHPWYGKAWDELDIRVHGGVTYCSNSRNYPLEIPEMDIWWVGFDCGHSWDDSSPKYYEMMDKRVPGYSSMFPPGRFGQTYKDKDYVFKEIESMASQAAGVLR